MQGQVTTCMHVQDLAAWVDEVGYRDVRHRVLAGRHTIAAQEACKHKHDQQGPASASQSHHAQAVRYVLSLELGADVSCKRLIDESRCAHSVDLCVIAMFCLSTEGQGPRVSPT
jgi:hypothetical protein